MDDYSAVRNPSPARPERRIAKVSRNVFCIFYDECLNVAVERNWLGFDCSDCTAYCQVDITEAWIQADSDKCKGFVMALFEENMTARHVRYVVAMLEVRRAARVFDESWLSGCHSKTSFTAGASF